MPLRNARQNLSRLWFIGSAIVGIFVFGLSLSWRSTEPAFSARLFEWLPPLIVPTLGVIVGFWIADFKTPVAADRTVPSFFLQIAFGLSLAYFLVVMTFPFVTGGMKEAEKIALLNQSGLWLGILQGPLAGVVGALFAQDKSTSSKG